MVVREELKKNLTHLIELNKDSAKAFKRAAAQMSDVQEKRLEPVMEQMADERATMVDQLQQAAGGLDNEAAADGTQEGMLERGWMNIKAAMTIEQDKTDAVVLGDRIEQEQEVLSTYENTLEKGLPAEVEALLRRQATEIEQTLRHLQQLREEIK